MITFKAHSKPVYALAFSPDGRFLLSSGGDEAVRVWSLNPVTEDQGWRGSSFWAPIAWSPDGQFVGRGGYGVAVWPLGVEEPLVQSDQFTEAVAFSPDGRVFVAAGHESHALTRWQIPSGKRLAGGWGGSRKNFGGPRFPTGGMAYRPDGTMLATCFGVRGKRDYDSVICLWDASSGQLLGELHAAYASAHPTALCFSPDGSLLAGTYGPSLRVWDVAGRRLITTLQAGKKHFKGVTFTPDGRRLVAVNNDALVRSWEVGTWAEADSFEWKIGKLGAVAIAPEGDRIAVGGGSGKVVVWDVVG